MRPWLSAGLSCASVGCDKVSLVDDRFVLDPQRFLGDRLGAETDSNLIAGIGVSPGLRS